MVNEKWLMDLSMGLAPSVPEHKTISGSWRTQVLLSSKTELSTDGDIVRHRWKQFLIETKRHTQF